MKKSILVILLLILGVSLIISGCSKAASNSSAAQTNTLPSTTASAATASAPADSPSVKPAVTDGNATSPDTQISQPDTTQTNSEAPVATEKNPPGDIPDTQVFINYASTVGGYKLQVPEGWARTENGGNVQYIDKFDGIKVEITDSALPLSADNIKNNQVVELQKTGHAVQVNSIKEATLKGGKAVIVAYDSNSEPDKVTNKQIRLENEKIYFLNNGKLAAITLWAPKGADNVDQWNLISNSFVWGK